VLLSGTGRTLENLLRVIDRGELDARVVHVVSSVAGARGLQVASEAGISHETLTRRGFADNDAYSDALFAALAPSQPQMILLCGFLRQLVVPPAWEGRILNIHPALLPRAASYAAGRGRYGERVHQAVLEHGDTVSGATVHLVTNDYDEGPPLLQREVPVLPDDTSATLGARVFATECALYPEAIRRYLTAHPELRTPPAYAGSHR
jgi:formyltetrahydrofolate-dependent phosphoribosylglycinamide formyltransferase